MIPTKHTPGTWEAWKSSNGIWTVRSVYSDDQGRRCTAWPAVCDAAAQDNEANAHLIAAAPEMLEALYAALPYIEAADAKVTAQVKKAIEKAEGRA